MLNPQRIARFTPQAFSEMNREDNTFTPPVDILLIRFGQNEYTKSGEAGTFEFTENDADTVIAEFISRKRDLVIDFEHQSLSGGKAPAAGWIDQLSKSAEGLFGRVKYWTEDALENLRKGEYRYYSPTLYFSRSGKSVSAVHSVALTNHPAMHNIPALAADDVRSADEESARAALVPSPRNLKLNPQPIIQENPMNELYKITGLEPLDDSTPDDVRRGALEDAVRNLVEARNALDRFLEAHHFSDLTDASEQMKQLVPKQKFDDLQNQLTRQNAEQAVAQAFHDGKLSESLRAWGMEFASKDLTAFREWCEKAPRLVPDNQDTEDPVRNAESGGTEAFTEKEQEIFKLLGIVRKPNQ